MSWQMWCEVAVTIRAELYDPERDAATLPNIARFTRRHTDLFKADNATFSYDWFLGARGLDNWSELVPNTRPRERSHYARSVRARLGRLVQRQPKIGPLQLAALL